MSFRATHGTKNYLILSRAITKATPRLEVMDLKIFPSSAEFGNASHPAPELYDIADDKF